MVGVYGISVRHVSRVLEFNRSTYYYKRRRDQQAVLRQQIKDIAYSRIHYGYRRIQVALQRQGLVVNHKRVYRLYCEERLALRRKKPKRRVKAHVRQRAMEINNMNDCWCMDFVADQLFTGETLRILTILDIFTRISPGIGIGFSYSKSN